MAISATTLNNKFSHYKFHVNNITLPTVGCGANNGTPSPLWNQSIQCKILEAEHNRITEVFQIYGKKTDSIKTFTVLLQNGPIYFLSSP